MFTDGTCVVNTPKVNVSYDSFGELDEKVVWVDEEDVDEPDPLFYATCRYCLTSFQNDKPIENIKCPVCITNFLNSGPVPGQRPNIYTIPALEDENGN